MDNTKVSGSDTADAGIVDRAKDFWHGLSVGGQVGVLVGSVAAAIILIFFIIVMYIYGYYPFAHKCWNCRKRVRSKDTVWVPRVVPKQTGALKKDDPKRVWDWTKRAIETDNEGNSKIYMCSPAKGCDGRNLLGMLFGRKSKMPEDPDERFIRDRVIPHR